VPVLLPGLSDAIALAAGGLHTCAIRKTGEVVCWGDNSEGQFGNGTFASSDVPVPVSGVSDAIAIGAGGSHTCVVRVSGEIACWGTNFEGELGDGSFSQSLVPVAVAGLSDAVSVTGGSSYSCATRRNGEVSCWGASNLGELGSVPIVFSSGSPVPVVVDNLLDAVAIDADAASSFTCAVRATGEVVCWGLSESQNGEFVNSPVPVAVAGLSDAISVTTGSSHACALRRTGEVACWGFGSEGELGNGAFTTSGVVAVSGLSNVVALAAAVDHTCAVRSSGEALCWGEGPTGELGNGAAQDSVVPTDVVGLSDAAAVNSGAYHACALRSTGEVACWGRGSSGQLGHGTMTGSSIPVAVSGLSDAVGVAAGISHSCAVHGGGTVSCWGYGPFGELGNGGNLDNGGVVLSSVPVTVSGLNDALAIGGSEHSCVVRRGGQVSCWGGGIFGELGDGNPANPDGTSIYSSAVPVTVLGLSDAVAVAGGENHTCALRSTGEVDCWGSALELGNGASKSSAVPVAVSGISDARAVAAGDFHTCALRAAGAVVCWGDNSSGQLGDGTFVDAAMPVPVSGLSDAVALAAGGFLTCAARTGGQVTCWGYGVDGELGNDGQTTSPVPVAVSTLSDAIGVAAGEVHACAVRRTGQVDCWGRSDEGQVGNGTPWMSDVPVAVLGIGAGAGAPCPSGGGCGTGLTCVDGVCCTSACGGGDKTDCQACSVAAGGTVDGTCTPSAPTYVCNPATLTCDVPEHCDGSSTTCPDDQYKAANTPCGTSIGPCDVAATCTGGAPDCPPNSVALATTKCYSADPTDPCKVDRFCTGTTNTCPSPDILAADCLAANQGTDVAFTFDALGGGDAGAPDGGADQATVTLTFYDITQSGSVGLVETDDVGPAPNPGFEALGFTGQHHYWEFKTNALYSGPPEHPELAIKICIHYPQSWITVAGTEANLYIEHWDSGGVGTKISDQTGLDTTNNIVCGNTPSLSPFALIAPLPSSLPQPSLPAPIVVEATSAAGPAVSYVASATDPKDGNLAMACAPASGSTFPIGTTTVNCTVTDSLGISASGSFTVTVRDTTGPGWKGVPTTPVVAYATSTAGAEVSYAMPTAVDAVDGPRTVPCTPASGSTFAPGKTVVTCTAADTRTNKSTATFTVWVQYQAPGDGTFFLQPINPDGSSIFKLGSTVPTKFSFQGESAGIANLAAKLSLAKVSSGIAGSYVEAVSTVAADSGSTFRYDAAGAQYVFNLSTKGMTAGTWSLRADLGDAVNHTVNVSLK
jgi:alpha-tubulin suppressor-like RCC1 family protein